MGSCVIDEIVLFYSFDGLLIDCSTKNPLGKLACGEIRNGGHQSIQPVNATTFKFSLLGGVSNFF